VSHSLQQCATSPQKERKEEKEKKEGKTGPENAQAGQEKEKKEENEKRHTSTDGLLLVAGGGIREALGERMR
jgi:hypothetical protein